nr:hypothetical protein KXZ65_01065 [Pectobacterium sp. PL152]
MTDRSMTESALAARWDGWLTCPQEHLHARMRDELTEVPLGEKTLAAMLAFVHEYRLNGVNWRAQGIRGDEIQASLQDLQHDAPPTLRCFARKPPLLKNTNGSAAAWMRTFWPHKPAIRNLPSSPRPERAPTCFARC